MNMLIELHDSTVCEFVKHDETVIVHFLPVYLHISEGRPGIDRGTGWVQEARLFFTEASISGQLPDWPCEVMHGELILGTERKDNVVPVPLEFGDRAELRLIFDNIHAVTVIGRSVRLELVGEPRYVEEFDPDSWRKTKTNS